MGLWPELWSALFLAPSLPLPPASNFPPGSKAAPGTGTATQPGRRLHGWMLWMLPLTSAALLHSSQERGGKVGELPRREKAPAVLPPEPFHSAGQQTSGTKKKIKKEINNHHPLCLHLPLIYGPAEKPCCPQLLGSQLLFAMISSPLLSTRLPSRPHPATCRCTGLWQLPGCSVAGSQPCPVPWWDGYWVSGSGLILQGPGMAAGVQKQEQGCRRLGHRAARGKRAVRWTASKANQKITFCPELLKIQLYRTRNQKLSTRFPFWPS